MINIKSSELTPLNNLLLFGIMGVIYNIFFYDCDTTVKEHVTGRYNQNKLVGFSNLGFVDSNIFDNDIKTIEHVGIFNNSLIVQINTYTKGEETKEQYFQFHDMEMYCSFNSFENPREINLIIDKDE